MIEYNEIEDQDNAIQEEYRIWKKNTPFLYDLLITNGLEWPSLTVAWTKEYMVPQDSCFSKQKLIIGTQTSDQEQNYLLICKVKMPLHSENSDYSEFNKVDQKFTIETRINHDGDVNKARPMPQKENLIATKTNSGEVHIFDYYSNPTQPTNSDLNIEMRLIGHTKEGYGLSWSTFNEGYVCSGSDDCKVLLWDINSKKTNESISPLMEFKSHMDIVEDVCFSKKDANIFASVGDDKKMLM